MNTHPSPTADRRDYAVMSNEQRRARIAEINSRMAGLGMQFINLGSCTSRAAAQASQRVWEQSQPLERERAVHVAVLRAAVSNSLIER
jgi:hypothetical protein